MVTNLTPHLAGGAGNPGDEKKSFKKVPLDGISIFIPPSSTSTKSAAALVDMRAILSIAFGLSAAAAAAAVNVPRDGDNDDRLPQAPWVTVNDEGNPVTTLTPAVSSVSGTPSPVDAAPHDLTASLYTVTNYGHVYTSTGLPPNPTATNAKTNEGSFSRCFNQRGAYAPFCRPTHNSTIYTGRTYYAHEAKKKKKSPGTPTGTTPRCRPLSPSASTTTTTRMAKSPTTTSPPRATPCRGASCPCPSSGTPSATPRPPPTTPSSCP
ncbi:hypothetical protein UVI_02016610 [Ustilaginoidea virens]|uniref:Uncharacterized protein n=1 Tax=Ustilaginoidea virens TaxID=1159556 RepID=A0A1B5KRP0_USTVR|nr:hypothetical protein UVI_02016610 [Ustilaginoidea virens]